MNMANITQLTDTLWTGGDLPPGVAVAAEHIRDWQRAGITTVIDARYEWTDENLVADLAPEITYVHLGIDDAGQRIPSAWFDRVLEAANATPAGEAVLVHCHMGINRGPSAAYALLLAAGHDPVEAIDRIRLRRPIAAVGYAEDALRWCHDHTGADLLRRREERNALAHWRVDNPHDTVRIIRSFRAQELGA
jgi:protein-tyrosine phosphatase